MITKKNILYIFIFLSIVISVVYNFYIVPKLYYIQYDDLQTHYYYVGQLLLNNGDIQSVIHPGIPIYYLSAFIHWLTGSSIENTANFFSIAIILQYVFLIGILIYCLKYFLKKHSVSISFLAITSVFCYPVFLVSLNRFGANYYAMVSSFIMLLVAWQIISETQKELPKARLLLCGILSGLVCAIKISVIPIVVSIGIATLFYYGTYYKTIKQGLVQWIIFPITTIGSFVVLTVPAFFLLPRTFFSASSMSGSFKVVHNFLQFPYYYQFLIIGVIGSVILLIVNLIYKKRITKAAQWDLSTAAKGVFVVLLIGSFIQSLAISNESVYPINLRYSHVSFFFIPFAILWISEVVSEKTLKKRSLPIVIITILLWGFFIYDYHYERVDFITKTTQLSQKYQKELNAISPGPSRIALWIRPRHYSILGKNSFHLIGNNFAIRDFYSRDILSYFPHYSVIRLYEIKKIWQVENNIVPKSPNTLIGKVIQQIKDKSRPEPRTNEIITGEADGEKFSHILIPVEIIENAIKKQFKIYNEMVMLIDQRYGVKSIKTQFIGDEDWLVIELQHERSRLTKASQLPSRGLAI